jgi:hypothetical protein
MNYPQMTGGNERVAKRAKHHGPSRLCEMVPALLTYVTSFLARADVASLAATTAIFCSRVQDWWASLLASHYGSNLPPLLVRFLARPRHEYAHVHHSFLRSFPLEH